MPLQATSGAASYDAFGGGVAAVPNYIEDVFNSYLWTTSASDQTLTTGIDMTKGALTWIKSRSNAFSHVLQTGIGGGVLPNNALSSNNTNAYFGGNYRIAESTTGFTMGTDYYTGTPETAVVWTFRKQAKFFDVVTYTGNGVNGRAISHSLGSTPGFIVVKCTSAASQWTCWHRSYNSGNGYGYLNDTTSWFNTGADVWGNGTTYTAPTSTTFTVNAASGLVNDSGATYVAYLFAHNAGGFGLTGTDNVISCGSFTTDANGFGSVTLGYEPQWVLIKNTTNAETWFLEDTMRSMTAGPTASALSAPNTSTYWLKPNLSDAEVTNLPAYGAKLQATGFTQFGGGGTTVNSTYIYIAIRRGPMKVPTDATKVYNAVTGTFSAGDSLSVGFPADMYIDAWRTGTLYKANYSRLVNFANSNSSASQNYLKTNTTDAEITTSQAPSLYNLWNTTANVGSWNAGVSEVWWMFRRAPSFFDEVCYTGTGSNLTVSHNLGAVPEIIIIKRRSSAASNNNWYTGWNMNGPTYMESLLNTSDAGTLYTYPNWFTSTPTTTTFAIAGGGNVNANTATYVAYLFATCAGVSKVGTYTGNGTTQTINCGFTGGARFVLIKRTDSTGDWYVYDTARGMTVLTDPYLLLNSTAAESATLGSVTTVSTGFAVNASILAAINTNAASYIFLAIA